MLRKLLFILMLPSICLADIVYVKTGGGGDYTTLGAAITGEAGVLSEDKTIRVSGGADTSCPDISGFTPGSYRIIIEGDPGEATGAFEGTEFDTGKYYLNCSDYYGALGFDDPNITLRNFQIRTTGADTGGNRAMGIRAKSNCGGEYRISGMFIQYFNAGDPATSNQNGMIATNDCNTSSVTWKVWNNITTGYVNGLGGFDFGGNTSQSIIAHNNTVSARTYGIFYTSFSGTTNVLNAKNNIFQDAATADYYTEYTAGTTTVTTAKNITEDTTSPNSLGEITVSFVSATDFALDGDANAVDGGDDLSAGTIGFSDDIEGDTRSGTWDIGADESAAAATPTPTPTATATATPTATPTATSVGTNTPTPTPTSTPIPAAWPTNASGTLDNDRDGYNSDGSVGSMGVAHKDCDDYDRTMYPGVYTGSGCSDGYRQCQTDGTYTSCTSNATPLCEADPTDNCYYVDCDTGNDADGGTYLSPWLTPRNVSYYSTGAPATHVGNLGSGDYLYISGDCTGYYDAGSPGNVWFAFGASGTASKPVTIKAYPGGNPTVDAQMSATNQGRGIYGYLTDYARVQGLSITGAYDSGIQFIGADNIVIERTTVYENDGNGNDNMAGIRFDGGSDWQVRHSLIYDNYDMADTGSNSNQHNIYAAEGTGGVVHHSAIRYTSDANGRSSAYNFKYKKAEADVSATFKFHHNQVEGGGFGVGSGQANTHLHHNLISGAGTGFTMRNMANTYYPVGFISEYNTVVDGPCYSLEFVTPDVAVDTVTVRYNVCEDDSTVYNSDVSIVRIARYESDATFTTVVTGGELALDYNCYYNNQAVTLKFDLFGGGEPLGDVYEWAAWNSTAGYDTNGYSEDPQLDSNSEAQSTNCDSWGWILPSGTPAPTPTPTETPTPSATPTATPTATSAFTPTATPTAAPDEVQPGFHQILGVLWSEGQ